MGSEERGTPKVEDANLTKNNKDDYVGINDLPIENDEQEQVTVEDLLDNEIAFKWEEEDSDAPEIPKHYKKLAESKFPIKVEDFFNLFFSDESPEFVESFHKKCGDKDFSCKQWYPHEQLGHAREISFQHPIKVYFGAKYGGCKEVQSIRVYKNSHLIISTSQEVSDVPYADYFQVEGIWQVQKDDDQSKDGCILQVYINVAFSKKTVWKGKIEQSTKEECREVYAIWIELAHEVLKQKHLERSTWRELAHEVLKQRELEKKESQGDVVEIEQALTKVHEEILEPLQRLEEKELARSRKASPEPQCSQQQTEASREAAMLDNTTLASLLRVVPKKLYSLLKSQGIGRMPHILLVFAVILVLIQLSIVVLLGRPQQVYVIPQVESANRLGLAGYQREADTVPWLEKRILLLKDEMLIMETHLERMRHEHLLIKAHLNDL